MFDSGVELPALGLAQLAGLIEQNHTELKTRESRMLQLACAWADAHYLDSGSNEYQPVVQRACAWGGEGTPEVSEYCAAELGALQGTGIMAARALIADALDLRYRLPRLWDRVLTGGVRAWQARRIAEQTRALSWEACADVDHALSDFVDMMPCDSPKSCRPRSWRPTRCWLRSGPSGPASPRMCSASTLKTG